VSSSSSSRGAPWEPVSSGPVYNLWPACTGLLWQHQPIPPAAPPLHSADDVTLMHCSKKYVIEQLSGEKVVSRARGFTVDTCVSAIPQVAETPEFQGLPTGDKVRIIVQGTMSSAKPTDGYCPCERQVHMGGLWGGGLWGWLSMTSNPCIVWPRGSSVFPGVQVPCPRVGLPEHMEGPILYSPGNVPLFACDVEESPDGLTLSHTHHQLCCCRSKQATTSCASGPQAQT
jgi:hypothetical protein